MLDALTVSLPTAIQIAMRPGKLILFKKLDVYFAEIHTRNTIYTGLDKLLLTAICIAYNQYDEALNEQFDKEIENGTA